MTLTDFRIQNYRSVKDVWLKLRRINVIVGPNGTGKSNLYRAMYLLASTATGQFARNIAEEGGIESTKWCGRIGKKEEKLLKLSVRVNELQYDVSCGTVSWAERPEGSRFMLDPEIKSEVVLLRKKTTSKLLERRLVEVKIKDSTGTTLDYSGRVLRNEPILSSLKDPYKYPYLAELRDELLKWRFYHHFRTDRESPLRRPQLPVATPTMSHDGSDLLSAIGTILEMGDGEGFCEKLDDAFPGAQIDILHSVNQSGLKLQLKMPDIARPFDAMELSDGTLQYLCLLAVFFSLNPPSVLAINEPETSIHPSLFEPLARLIVSASTESQIWITTHSQELADHILDFSGYEPLELEKVDGETKLVGVGLGGYKEDDDDIGDDDDLIQ